MECLRGADQLGIQSNTALRLRGSAATMMRAVAVTLRVLNQARDGSSTKGGKVQK